MEAFRKVRVFRFLLIAANLVFGLWLLYVMRYLSAPKAFFVLFALATANLIYVGSVLPESRREIRVIRLLRLWMQAKERELEAKAARNRSETKSGEVPPKW
jgi:hypothetical protein